MIGEGSQKGGGELRQAFNCENNFSNDENVLKRLDDLPGIGCSQGARVPRLCYLQSR